MRLGSLRKILENKEKKKRRKIGRSNRKGKRGSPMLNKRGTCNYYKSKDS
jgi:hypothetical protein